MKMVCLRRSRLSLRMGQSRYGQDSLQHVGDSSHLNAILPLPSLAVLFKTVFQCKTDPGPSRALPVMRDPS